MKDWGASMLLETKKWQIVSFQATDAKHSFFMGGRAEF